LRRAGGMSAAPPQLAHVDGSPLCDLLIGTCLIAGIVAYEFWRQRSSERRHRVTAQKRSLSCPALLELQKPECLAACVSMMAAFEERRVDMPFERLVRADSLPTLHEDDEPSMGLPTLTESCDSVYFPAPSKRLDTVPGSVDCSTASTPLQPAVQDSGELSWSSLETCSAGDGHGGREEPTGGHSSPSSLTLA
jgi:hypothetical protein